ncbi:facilitated trehalose transporter Tret1-like [Periplaneta americana]|uniref:facilitated trehalose transporter Tret1-like n=1 Tax=Periplaneta americana TaxID=6978 RepID=UPI0037E78AB8
MAGEQATKTKPRRLLFPQLIVAFVCALAAISCGMGTGHSMVLIPRLQQNDSTIPIDDEIGSWIASIYYIGVPIGNVIGGSLTDILGRRMMLRLSQLPCILSWILLASAQSYQVVIATRLVSGIARGMVVDSVVVLMDEHSDVHLRGALYMQAITSYVVGILIITGIGTVLEWRTTAGIAVIFPIAVLVGTLAVPETPIWLVRKGKTHIASSVLEKAWGKHQNVEAKRELESIISRCRKETILLKVFLRPHVIKSFVIAFLLMMLQNCTGVHIIMIYSVDIISRVRHGSQDLLDEYAVTNISGFFRFAVLIFLAWLTLRVRRRIIVLSSAIASGICLLSLGTVVIINSKSKNISERAESWIVISLIFLYIAANTGGIFALPASLVGELIPSKIRGLASGVIFAVNEVAMGGLLKSYPLMLKTMGVHGMFWLFGFFSLLFALFVFLFVPETHNHTLAQVEEYFQGHNILWQNRPKDFRKEKSLQQQLITPHNTPDMSQSNTTVYIKLRGRELSESQC